MASLCQISVRGVHDGKSLLKKGVFDFAGFRRLGHQRSGLSRGIFGEQDGDGFSIRRPFRSCKKTFHAGQFVCGATAYTRNIELRLARYDGVGKKRDLLAVRRPGNVAFIEMRSGPARSHAHRLAPSRGLLHINILFARGGAFFVGPDFNPGNSFAVRRNCHLIKILRPERALFCFLCR